MSVHDAVHWQHRDVPFKFQLSDLSLATIRVPLLTREIGLTQDAPPQTQLIAPAQPLSADRQGFLVASQPVACEQAPLQHVGPYLCYVASQYPRYYIDLQQSFDSYKGKFSSKTRSTITRKIKKFTEFCGGALRWQSYKSAHDMQRFFELARSVSAKSYQEKLLDAGLPDTPEYLAQAQALAAADAVRGYILFHGERAVSYLYCPATEGVLLYAYLGYDPAYAEWSVGTILQWHALEEIFAENRFRLFDFTEGQSEHKRLFATHNVQCANVFFLRNTLRNRLLVRAHRRTNRLSSDLGQLLDRWGIKAKIKRLIRFGRSS